MQMIANAVTISETDVIGQIFTWCDNPILLRSNTVDSKKSG